jgi:hypothetical protein
MSHLTDEYNAPTNPGTSGAFSVKGKVAEFAQPNCLLVKLFTGGRSHALFCINANPFARLLW